MKKQKNFNNIIYVNAYERFRINSITGFENKKT